MKLVLVTVHGCGEVHVEVVFCCVHGVLFAFVKDSIDRVIVVLGRVYFEEFVHFLLVLAVIVDIEVEVEGLLGGQNPAVFEASAEGVWLIEG